MAQRRFIAPLEWRKRGVWYDNGHDAKGFLEHFQHRGEFFMPLQKEK
jgi:hypothetical protein